MQYMQILHNIAPHNIVLEHKSCNEKLNIKWQ